MQKTGIGCSLLISSPDVMLQSEDAEIAVSTDYSEKIFNLRRQIMTPDEYCRHKADAQDTDFYYSALFLPEQRRHAVTALYAFRNELDALTKECSERSVARAKLDWWEAEIGNLFADRPRHPVTRSLSQATEDFGFTQPPFLEIIDAVRVHLEYDAYPSFTGLLPYCQNVFGGVNLLITEACGYSQGETKSAVLDLGIALQLMRFLTQARHDIRKGRLYLPLDELNDHHVSPNDLTATHTSENVRRLFATQVERIKDYLVKGLDGIPNADRSQQLFHLIMATLNLTLLREIEADDFRLLDHQLRLTPLRELWIAWRLARNTKRYRRMR